ncbi:MAG: galactokinase [Novosphingobium sp.]|uniref:galactokinase n=1 Tax=Novosphingobium sp. TaxID=1874826 RepID=UPI003C7C662E
MELAIKTGAGYRDAFGSEPAGVVFAPGRVNLIGEHVDYNDGLVLPMPLTVGTAVAWGAASGAAIEVVALDFGAVIDRFVPGEAVPHDPADWRSYVRGMAAAGGSGAQLAIAGTIPRGSGLSSSASLCVAVGRALALAQGGADPPPRDVALVAQRAEHEWAGVRCGIMDQMAVAAGAAGHALLLDCRTLGTRQVPLPADWAIMVVQSGVVRGLVDGHYNARRADCEAAALALGVASLRDADAAMLAGAGLDPVIARRALHVVEEIARVRAAVSAIEARDLEELGGHLRASHASLRDLFEVSVPPVDRLVDVLNSAIGASGGARMTGGGFGGAVVAVLPVAEVARVRAAVEQNYQPPGGAALSIMIEGAGGHVAGTGA